MTTTTHRPRTLARKRYCGASDFGEADPAGPTGPCQRRFAGMDGECVTVIRNRLDTRPASDLA